MHDGRRFGGVLQVRLAGPMHRSFTGAGMLGKALVCLAFGSFVAACAGTEAKPKVDAGPTLVSASLMEQSWLFDVVDP